MLNDWTFRLGNGDCGGDPALIVHWLIRNGIRRPGVIAEISPNGEEYFNNFRRECLRWGLEIGGVQSAAQTTDKIEYHLGRLKDIGCDGLVHMGYGMHFVHDLMRPALKAIDWDPPRITTTAFMFYLRGMSKFNGWVGIDQLDPGNPLVEPFRHVASRAHDKVDTRDVGEPVVPGLLVRRRGVVQLVCVVDGDDDVLRSGRSGGVHLGQDPGALGAGQTPRLPRRSRLSHDLGVGQVGELEAAHVEDLHPLARCR